MNTYLEAIRILEESAAARCLSCEAISVEDSLGRILADDLRSPEEVPSFTNSAMDGFALFSSDTRDASPTKPARLPVSGLVAAGDARAYREAAATGPGHVVEIMTGAPLPAGGFDAVVRIEDVNVERAPDGAARAIEVFRPAQKGDNIRLRGTDFAIGQNVLRAGTRIGPEHLLACASLGITQVNAKALPRIAIVSTGSELVDHRESAASELGMIRNSTAPFLIAALRRLGAEVRYLGIVRDEPAVYRKKLEEALTDHVDIVISTGAVSMGKFDFVSDVLNEMGAVTRFHKAAIRPGKPILFAEMSRPTGSRSVFFGAPGNPVSTAVALRFFIEPYIRSMLGLPREEPVNAKLARNCSKPAGLRCFFKGHARAARDGIEVTALRGQASYVVSALLDANCWVVFPEDRTDVTEKSEVEIYPLHNGFERGVLS